MRSKIIYILLALLPLTGFSQKKDSLANIAEFLSVCTSYKQVPLSLQLQLVNINSVAGIPSDSSKINGGFYLTSKGSYITFGDMEQIVTDSAGLIISTSAKRMIQYDDTKKIMARMNSLMGPSVNEGELKSILKNFTVVKKLIGKDEALIELTNNAVLGTTDIHGQVIRLKYDQRTKKPLEVISVTKTFVQIDSAEYTRRQNNGQAAFLAKKGTTYFVLKEQSADYRYLKIEHSPSLLLPVVISDRIMRNKKGEYVPVKGYEGYVISKGN